MKLLHLALIVFSFSCISKKKYNKLTQDKSKLEVEKAELIDSLAEANKENASNEELIEQQLRNIAKLQGDSIGLQNALNDLSKEYVKLNKLSKSDAKRLSDQISKVGQLSQDLESHKKLVELDQKKIDSLTINLEERERKVAELEQMLASKEAYMQKIQDQLKQALIAFEDNDLSVEIKDGKVYISLNNELVFQSGSYKVGPKGKELIIKIAESLKETDVIIDVEGHTDDIPLKPSGDMTENWDLSVLRATSIVKIFQSQGLAPERIIASGRGEYQPKINEKTKEARKINRRIEIIISPNLDDLYDLIQQIEEN